MYCIKNLLFERGERNKRKLQVIKEAWAWSLLLAFNLLLCRITNWLLLTVCADGVLRVFKLDDASGKSFKYDAMNRLLFQFSYC